MAFTVTARHQAAPTTTSAASATTNSTTPTANSLFITAGGAVRADTGGGTMSLATPTGGSLTQTLVAKTGESPEIAFAGDSRYAIDLGVWRAPIGGAPSAFTVTVDGTTGSGFQAAVCLDITGHDPTTPITEYTGTPNTGTNGADTGSTGDSYSGTVTLSHTPTTGNLIVVAFSSGGNAGGFATPTAGSGKTMTAVTAQNGAYYQIGVWYRVVDGSESTTITCSDLGTGVGNWTAVAFEVSAGSGGGIPATIAGLGLWLDASDAATITSSGGAVSQWNDKSSGVRHVTQATGGNQPTTGTNTLNSLNVITFDGTADYLSGASSQLVNASTGEWTAFSVQRPATTSGVRIIVDQDPNTPRVFIIRNNAAASQALAFNTVNSAATDAGTSISASTAAMYSAVRTATTVEMFVNGTSSAATATSGTPQNVTATFRVGAQGSASPGSYFSGDIAEILVYNVALTTTDRQTIETYLTSKWISGGTSGTATPAAIALTAALPAAIAQASASTTPTVMVPTLTLPAATASASSSGTATPGVIAATITLPAATPLAGTVTSPSVIAATITMPAATASGAAAGTATPAAIATTLTMPAATASGATAGTATPAAITATVTMAQATATASKTVTPAALALTVSMPAASATGASPGTATPAPITATVTMPATTLQYGWVATPGAIIATVTMPAAVASNSKTALPAAIPITVTLPAAATQAGSTAQPNAVALVTVQPPPTLRYGYVVNPAVIHLAVSLAAALGVGLEPDPNPVTVTVHDRGHTITVRVTGTTTTVRDTGTTTTARQGH